jgi:hypothetical protein
MVIVIGTGLGRGRIIVVRIGIVQFQSGVKEVDVRV